MLAKVLIRGGLGLLVAGIAVWLWPWGRTATENWSPVEIPVRLERGREVTARFATDRSGTYWVILRVYRDIPFEELDRALGSSWSVFGEDEEGPVVIPWEIHSGSEVIAEGSGQGKFGSSSADVATVRLGSFESEENREYTISASVERSVDGLLGCRTEVAVEADPMYFKQAFAADLARSAVGFLCMVLPGGLALLVGLALRKWGRRRSAADES